MSTALMAPRRKPITPRGRRGAYSGLVARIAGDDAINADQFLPNMASEEFVSCLSRTALEAVAETAGVPGRSKLKDTRAGVVEHFADRLVLPAPGGRWRLPSGTVHRYRKNARLTTACAISTHRPKASRVLQPGQSRVKDPSRFDRDNADRWSSWPSSPSNIQAFYECIAMLVAGRRTTTLAVRRGALRHRRVRFRDRGGP
jgi:hypothetical protein